jgi:hypothetical protein
MVTQHSTDFWLSRELKRLAPLYAVAFAVALPFALLYGVLTALSYSLAWGLLLIGAIAALFAWDRAERRLDAARNDTNSGAVDRPMNLALVPSNGQLVSVAAGVVITITSGVAPSLPGHGQPSHHITFQGNTAL